MYDDEDAYQAYLDYLQDEAEKDGTAQPVEDFFRDPDRKREELRDEG